jgi:hypothetical protein
MNYAYAALIIGAAALVLGFVYIEARESEGIDWDAPADDLDDDYARDIPANVIHDDDTGAYVCAVPASHLPSGICGWPVDSSPCPDHHNGSA